MNRHWIEKSLEYHGLPLKTAWDGERGDQELASLNLSSIDYSTYRTRSKNFGGLAERRVRNKLHAFIVKNAPALFDPAAVDCAPPTNIELSHRPTDLTHLPVIQKAPPFECFLLGQGILRCDRVCEVCVCVCVAKAKHSLLILIPLFSTVS